MLLQPKRVSSIKQPKKTSCYQLLSVLLALRLDLQVRYTL